VKRFFSQNMTLSLAVFSLCLWSVLFPCLILVIAGTVNLSISGFAVDNSDRLYVGTKSEICVYEKGKKMHTISPHTSRTYVFTITDGESILLSTSTKIYVMDLYGNILETRDDPGADIYNQISYRKKAFISKKGDIYKLSNVFGRTKIIKNDAEVLYQIDTFSFAIKILVVICIVALFVFCIGGLITSRVKRRSTNKAGDSFA